MLADEQKGALLGIFHQLPLLLRLTVNSTLYCLSAMTASWGFKVVARSGPAFHLLTSGSAWRG
jgi:hypothetical protein